MCRESFATIQQMSWSHFRECDKVALERVWQSLLTRYNQVLRTLGCKESEVEHTATARNQLKTSWGIKPNFTE